MLTEEKKIENKGIFIDLLKSTNEDVDKLIEYLENGGFFDAPASTKYHCSYSGGLCEHSLNVYNEFNRLVKEYYGDSVPQRTIIFLGLLHDIIKMNYYELYTRNVKNDSTGQWEKVLEYKVKDANERFTFGTNTFNNYMLISCFVALSEGEIASLVNYNCGMDDNYANKDLSAILSKYPLTLLLHSADMISTYILER